MEELKALSATEMAAKLGRLIERILNWEATIPQKNNHSIQTMIDDAKARIVNPKNYESMFHCFRARLEQMLDEGYSVQPITKEDRAKRAENQLIHKLWTLKATMPQEPYSADGPPFSLIPQMPQTTTDENS